MTTELPPRAPTHTYARRAMALVGRRLRQSPIVPGPRALARVLVSEDDPGIRELYARLLADYGFEVMTAPGGEAAPTIALARRYRPQLLITDVNKPGGMDGLAMQNALRNDHRLARLPVLVVSAVAPPTRALVVDDYLLKPFGFEDLVERAAALLPLSVVDHDLLAAAALRHGCHARLHPLTGLPCLHGLADELRVRGAATGIVASLRLTGQRAFLRVHGRPQLELLLGWLGSAIRDRAPGLLAGHLGFDGQIAVFGAPERVETALAAINAAFSLVVARLARTTPGLPLPTLALRRASLPARAADPIALRRALR